MTRAEILDTAKSMVTGQREQEEWRCIPSEPGYAVSSAGRVKSNARTISRRNGRAQTIRERILKQSLDEWGYPQVRLNGHTYKVHRLVAMMFLPERPEGYVVRHLDGNPANNSVENLKLGTNSENVLDGYNYRGYIRDGQKLSLDSVVEIKKLFGMMIPSREIAMRFGVSEQTICDIKHGRIYKYLEA